MMGRWSGALSRWLAVPLAGLVIGAGATRVALPRLAGGSLPIVVGPWHTSTTVGSAAANPYVRAEIARTGLLALNRAETIYFEARTDDEGRPLRAACAYDITGGAIASRWWSITAYGDDFFLIPNAEKRFSATAATLHKTADGAFTIALGPARRGVDWLPTGDMGGGFNLLVRLYNPEPGIALEPGRAKLPGIKRVGACAS